VSDIVQGMIKMMKSGEVGPINLGSDIRYKIVDVAGKVLELTGSKSQATFKKPLLFMTPLGLPDITLAKERLSWFPVVLLEEGLRNTIDYLRASRSRVKPGFWFKK
jgi:UDP-glucuronate decarboxylase